MPHFWQNSVVKNKSAWNTIIWSQERSKGKPKAETEFSQSLLDSLALQIKSNVLLGVTLLDINNEELRLHISLFVYAKSVQTIFWENQ